MALYDSMIPEKKRRAETPYTFIGPDADKAIVKGAKDSLNQVPPESFTAEQGMASGNFLQKTAKGYPNTGLTVKLPESAPMTLNVAHDAGPLLGQPSAAPPGPAAAPVNLMGTPKNFVGGTMAGPAEPTAADQQTANQTLSSFSEDGTGGRLKSTAPFPRPGSTFLNAGDSAHPGAVPVSLPRLALAGKQMGTTRGNGFEFHGTAEDAAKFMAPVGGGPRSMGRAPVQQDPSIRSPLDISIAARDEINGKTQTLGTPKYLTKDEGAAMGLGWKGRMAKYKEDIDAYNRASGEKTALDIESMREAGAGNRALLHASGVNDANAIARERMGGELELNQARIGTEKVDQQGKQLGIDAAKRMEAVQQAYISEQDPLKKRALANQWRTLQGKDAAKYQIVTKKGVAADGFTPTETSYFVDPDTRETVEIGGGQPQKGKSPPEDLNKYFK